MTFSSSRTLPGHAYSASSLMASGEIACTGVPLLRVNARQEVLDERRNVFAALAQRRHGQVNDVQPVEQVLAERALGDHVAQVAVGRGDDAHVDAAHRAIGADLLQLAGLQEPQQQALHAQRHLADFVEEDGAAVGHLELALLVAIGAGEAALHVAEELGLEQRFGQAGAVDGDHGAGGTRAPLMDRVRDELLADAALAGDQDLRIGARDALDLLRQFPNRGAAPNQLSVTLASHAYLCVLAARGSRSATRWPFSRTLRDSADSSRPYQRTRRRAPASIHG